MRIKLNWVFLIIVLFISVCVPQEVENTLLSQKMYIDLCGVWDTGYNVTDVYPVSWGRAKVSTAQEPSTIIDLGEDPFFFMTRSGGLPKIVKIKGEGNSYHITITTEHIRNKTPDMKMEYTLKVTVIDRNTLYFHWMDWNKVFDPFLIDPKKGGVKLIRVDGPKIIFYQSIIENLRFRNKPFLSAKTIRQFNKNEKLIVLEKGKSETINGVKGKWVRVLTEKNETGWCFNAYIEPTK